MGLRYLKESKFEYTAPFCSRLIRKYSNFANITFAQLHRPLKGLFVFFMLIPFLANAEGTRQLTPAFGDNGNVFIRASTSPFATYTTTTDTLYKLVIHVCNPGEKIYFGFRPTEDDIYFRIKDPNDNIVFGPTLIPSAPAQGRIESYNEAFNGPSVIAAGGYNAYVYDPPAPGEYYIEFNDGDPVNVTTGSLAFTWFDITVVDTTTLPTFTRKDGRVWSREWLITCNSFTNPFNGTMFIYSNDGIVTNLNFNGIMPYVFTIAANSVGTQNTGMPAADRQSKNGNINFPDYKIFLNDPDSNCYPTGIYGGLTASSTVTGCDPASRCINVFVDKDGQVDLVLDINGTPGFQPGTTDLILSSPVTVGANCIPWNGNDGLGNPIIGGTTIPLEVQYQNGITHLPLYDVENHPGGYIVELVRPQNGVRPNLFWDDTQVTGALELNGCTDSTGCHRWGDGSGGTNTLGNVRTINTWWLANIVADSISFDFNDIVVDANAGNGANANDTTICSNVPNVQLNGAVSGSSTTGQWSSTTGGTFSPSDTALSTLYNFTAADTIAGQATIVLTSTNNGLCTAVTDTMTITIPPGPFVEAGVNQSVCENNPIVNLSGTITNIGSATWTTGAGTYLANNTILNPSYTLDPAEVTAGSVALYLTTPATGTSGVIDVVTSDDGEDEGTDFSISSGDLETPSEAIEIGIRFQNLNIPTGVIITNAYMQFRADGTDAGAANIAITAEDIDDAPALVDVGGNVINRTNTTAVVNWNVPDWTGGDQGADQRTPDLSVVVQEVVSRPGWSPGNDMMFILEGSGTNRDIDSENDGNPAQLHIEYTIPGCPSVSDSVVITVTTPPTANAGTDDSICDNNPDIALNGSVTIASGGRWSGGAGSYAPNDSTLNAVYTPTAGEISSGSLTLYLTTIGNGGCTAVTDTVEYTFTNAPTADAGPDQTVCQNNDTVTLSGAVTIATGGSWSNGGGTYVPNNTTLAAQYVPSGPEVTAGTATLYLTTTGNGNCNAVADTMEITILASPTVSAGPDGLVCANNPNTNLNGTMAGAGGNMWTSALGGTFAPSDTILNPTYTPSAAEMTAGIAIIINTTTFNGSCNAATDTMLLLINAAPTANAGPDQNICENNPATTLDGTSANATSVAWTGGAGGYTPNSTQDDITYTPTNPEITSGSLRLYFTASNPGLGCLDVTDTIDLTFTAAPTVDAGVDVSVCANNPDVSLTGVVTGSTGGVWTGNGTFTPDSTTLITTYTPTAAEITAGSAQLILTTTGNGTCNAVTDTIDITITPAPTVDAGVNDTVCGNNVTAQLLATETVATGGMWTGGAGLYVPSNTDSNAQYVATGPEIAAGFVDHTWTTTGNGNCTAESDVVRTVITPAPTVDAGPNVSVCSDNPQTTLAGVITVATGGIWSNGAGLYAPDNTTLNATYSPSPGEISAGQAVLYLSTTGNGNCNLEQDSVVITITPFPTVDAGPDQTVCGSVAGVPLNGIVTVATGGSWASLGTGGGFTPNNTTLNTTFNPSATDISNGSVQLVLTTTGNGNCLTYTDTMQINFDVVPSINAGPDQTVCTNDFPIQLAASGSPATWSGGTGGFDNNNAHNAVYTPGAGDVTAGTVTLTITTTAGGTCAAIQDQVVLTLPPGPIADPGPDTTICASVTTLNISGSITNATGGQWSSSGTGSFGSTTNLNTTYTPSAADTAANTIYIKLTSTGNGACSADEDSLTLIITPAVYAQAGSDFIACADSTGIPLNGNVVTALGGVWSNGAGTFAPNDSALNALYTPTGADTAAGFVDLVLTTYGNGSCAGDDDTVRLSFTTAPIAYAGGDQTICANTTGVNLTGAVSFATGGQWSTSGSGGFSTSSTDLNAVYSPSGADTAAGTVDIILETTGNGDCRPKYDTLTLTFDPVPVVFAGNDTSVCADIGNYTMQGSVANAGGGYWTTSGSGTFAPDSTALTGTYTVSSGDSLAGVVTLTLTSTNNLTCNAVTDQVIMSFTPAPTISAGADQTVCKNIDTISISASFTVATGVEWSSLGTGTFVDSLIQNAEYMPSAVDTAAGSVSLVVSSTGNGTCQPVTDTMTITFTPEPTVNAGTDITVCADTFFFPVNGTVNNAGGGEWFSSGTGSFLPNELVLSSNYVPTASDTTAGAIKIWLTSTGNGPCNAVTDTLDVTINSAPYVEAGADITVCADSSGIPLSGLVEVAAGGQWFTTGSGTFSDTLDLNATYTPSATDTAAGALTITLRTTGNGLCREKSDNLTLNITPAPTIDAGPDQTICADDPDIQLNASVTVATGGTWTSALGTFSPSVTDLNGNFFHGVTEDTIDLVLTSTGNGLCRPVTDSLTLIVTSQPTVNAGPDQIVCNNGTGASLNGTVGFATGGTWVSSGAGSFFPSANDLNATYDPDVTDTLVYLRLTTTGIGTCIPVSDSIRLDVDPLPTINAGPDQNACTDADKIQLNASYTNALGIKWLTSGTGFFDDSSLVNANYVPSALDKANGTVSLTIQTLGTGSCDSVTDNMVITFSPEPTADAGNDFSVCTNDDTLTLTGIVTNSPGGFWDTDGAGSFVPDADSTTVVYLIQQADKDSGSINFIFYANGTGSCLVKSDLLTVSFTAAPVISAGGPVDSACTDTSGFQLNGSGASGIWSGGAGTFVPDATSLNATYKPTGGEITGGTVMLTLTTTNTGSCPVVSDSVEFTLISLPQAFAGADITVCADTNGVQLNGSVTNAGGGIWTTSGSGTFADSSVLNTVYIPGLQDIADSSAILTLTTTGNGLCNADFDNNQLFINPAPTIDAGFDVNICADLDSLQLDGSFTNAGGGVWTTDGSGGFGPSDSLVDSKYGISAADQTDSIIEFYFTSTGNGLCRAVQDTMIVSMTAAPTIDAGLSDTVCETQSSIPLGATYTIASGAFWFTTNGQGTINPSPFNDSITYNPVQADIDSGSVRLYSITLNAGTCNPVLDSIDISFQLQPTVNAGPNDTICANNSGTNLNGSFSNSTGAVWSTPTNGTFSDSTDTLAVYAHTAVDSANLGVILTLTSTGNGVCNAATDVMSIYITPAPVSFVNAGLDQTICADDTVVALTGFIDISAGGLWKTLGSGTFTDTLQSVPLPIPSTDYIVSPADIAAGTVDITLETVGNGLCNVELDTMTITINPLPTINAGANVSVCADTASIQLAGTQTSVIDWKWSSTGGGSFTPNEFDLNAVYFPTQAELDADAAGGAPIILTLEATDVGLCIENYQDQMELVVEPRFFINAGPDQEICADQSITALSGSVTNADSTIWTTSGSGVIADTNSLLTTYTTDSIDIANGVVNMILTTADNSSMCKQVTDNLLVTITPAPTVDAGLPMISCENNPDVSLNGAVTVATGGRWITGSGSYSPSDTLLNAVYTPSSAEISAGAAQLILETTGNGKCQTYYDTVNVTIVPKPAADAAVLNICTGIGQSTLLNGSVTNATGGIWSSSGTGIFTPSAATLNGQYEPSAADISSGSVTLTLTTDGNGTCNPETDDRVILIKELPVSNPGSNKTICRGNSTTIVGQAFPDISYEWFDMNNSSITTGAILTPTVSTDSSFVLAVTDLENCEVRDTVTIFVIDPPTFNLAPFYCLTDTLEIDAAPTGALAFGNYQWYRNGLFISQTDTTVLIPSKITSVGTYSISYSFEECTVIDSTPVTRPTTTNVDEVIFCEKDGFGITLDAGPGTSYLWDSTGNTGQLEVVFLAGTYPFIVFDANGCGVNDTMIATDICEPKVYVPTAIGPNMAQGQTLEIFGTDFTNFKIWIYNRWGELIFFSDDETIEWDGTFRGNAMPPGVYSWRIEYTGLTPQFSDVRQEHGSVTIVR